MPESAPEAHILSGRCTCGAVEYAVADAFDYALNCHCSGCRRATGSAFKPFAGIARDKLAISSGADRIMIVGEAANHDARCGTCGALLFSLVRDGAFAHIALGSLLDAPSLRPTAHIFVGSKASWYEITDGLPQHETHAG